VERYGGVFLDVDGMTALRGDGHRGRLSSAAGGEEIADCLHYCAPGPVDEWTRLLYNALIRLFKAPPALPWGLGFNCRGGANTDPRFCRLFSPFPSPPRAMPVYDILFMLVSGLRTPKMQMSDQHIGIALELAEPGSRVHILTDGDETLAQVGRLAGSLPGRKANSEGHEASDGGSP